MRELIQKKTKSAKIFRTCLIVVAILCILLFLLGPYIGDEELISVIMFYLFFALTVFVCVYLKSFHPFMKSIKWLRKKGLEHIADDIPLANTTLPKSKIYCGAQAFFTKKSRVIIPYAEVAWVYYHSSSVNRISVRECFEVFCRDGQHFVLNADKNELQWLLVNVISKFSPNLIVGYGRQQQQMYNRIKNDYIKGKDKKLT